ncbi:hypothetical protein VM1G_11408 [Cytospora mali]|uniref:Uncharacterized protein n=1 Tax=Cytospora mali TaxID=578113 RepID=A0A194VR52_CYTMA|nr:hypothetical protein VM1G_11408 [Valsa mali]
MAHTSASIAEPATSSSGQYVSRWASRYRGGLKGDQAPDGCEGDPELIASSPSFMLPVWTWLQG